MKNIRIIILSVLLLSVVLWFLFELNKSSDEYLYGNSYRQNKLVNTIRLHKYGITGEKITIGIIDAGFYTQHTVFKKAKIVKEFDFVTKKSTTANFEHIKGMDHGTNVFSVVGGYKVNELIGIAYDANFILAKTDISTDRLKEEENNAVKASRWMFQSGANIITTSLSFNKFDNANYYFPYQMNGKTARITRTADSLVNLGVIYVCSAGNNYEEQWRIIEPPGDGFKVLTVGSIDKNLNHSFFSSCGPTVDGRIKPDIVTPGEGVWTANYLPKLLPVFSWNHGTSLSAPIAAGIAALVLSAHPELSNEQVIKAIKNTSSKSNNPDNLYGWGVPDAEKAVTYYGPAFSNTPELNNFKDKLEVRTYVFSSFGLVKSSVKMFVLKNDKTNGKIFKMKEIKDNYYLYGINLNEKDYKIKIYFKAKDRKGDMTKFPSGILGKYFVLRKIQGKFKIIN